MNSGNLEKVAQFLEGRKDKILWNITDMVEEMAKEYGVCKSTIWRWLKPLTKHKDITPKYTIKEGIVYFKKGKESLIFAEKYRKEVEQKYDVDFVRIKVMDDIRVYRELLKEKKKELDKNLFTNWLKIEIRQKIYNLEMYTHRILLHNPEAAIDMVIDRLENDERGGNSIDVQRFYKELYKKGKEEAIKFFYAILNHPEKKIKETGKKLYLSMLLEENKQPKA